MQTAQARKAKRPRPSMNVTPLVDVVLVLLIIFMVVAPMLEHAAQVDLPSIFHIDVDRKGKTDPITLSLTRDGSVFVEEERLPAEQVEARLRKIHEAEPRRRVLLRGDVGVRFGDARALFLLCQDVGFRGVSLMVGSAVEDAKARKAARASR